MSHPIEGLMQTTMESIKGMVDVDTIISSPVETPDGSVIIPISRVGFGFAAGGGDYNAPGLGTQNQRNAASQQDSQQSFAGGSGAGVSLQPVAFLVVGQGSVRLLPVYENVLADRLLDMAPSLLEKLDQILNRSQGGASDS